MTHKANVTPSWTLYEHMYKEQPGNSKRDERNAYVNNN